MDYRFSNSVRILSSFSINYGGVAHLGERIPCTDKVAGSIPVASTIHPVSDKVTAEELRWMHTPQNVWCVGVTDGGPQLTGFYGN